MQILRFGLPLLMLVHGVSHLPGFVTSWRLRSLPDFPYHTVVLRGRVDIHDSGMRILGALWLTAALAFCLSAVAAFARDERWLPLAFAASVLSIVLCILEWPIARVGLWISVALLAALPLAMRFSWW
jgi:hypothetical protein